MPLLARAVAGRQAHASLHALRFFILSTLLGTGWGCGGTEPQVPGAVTLNTNTLAFTALGDQQQLTPTITDQNGKPLPATVASWSSSDPLVASVTQSGLVTALHAGAAEITATAGAVTASAQVSVVQTPASIQKISGDGQTALAGATLPNPLVVQVNDSRGNPIPNATVTFTVTEGDGSISISTATTGADGRASTSFTTGTSSGSSQVVSAAIASTALTVSFSATASADPTSFNIGIRFLTPATPAQQRAFTDARIRWEAAITGDLEDTFLNIPAGSCASGIPAVNQEIDDVLIMVRLVPIDNEGGVLGNAGPCYVRDFAPSGPPFGVGDLPILGVMQFDIDDLEMIESDGFLSAVILHEMGHVLGSGTMWGEMGLLADPTFTAPPPATENPGADPHFTGAQALAAFEDVGGVAYVAGSKVPVENQGGRGTADGHWREEDELGQDVFGNELMTGFIGPGLNPLSIVTVASLGDQGYSVDLAQADPYNLFLSLRVSGRGRTLRMMNDILRLPIKQVDSRGRVTGELRR